MNEIEVRIINSKLHELLDLRGEASSWPKPLALYLEVLIAYLKNDLQEAQEASAKLSEFVNSSGKRAEDSIENEEQSQWFFLVPLALARCRCRMAVQLDEALKDLSEIRIRSSLWLGEISFVKALLYGAQHAYDREFAAYSEAHFHLEKAGASAKALLALHNSLATLQSVKPNKIFIVEYTSLLDKALKKKCFSTAGLSALNLSRQYQTLGSTNVSLKFANLAIKCLKRDLGTQHYGLALCQRAHVLFEMARGAEALLDLEEAKAFDFVEVKNAIRWLESFSKQTHFEPEGNQAPAWATRGLPVETSNATHFGVAEEKLIRSLAKMPMAKDQLLEAIYPQESKSLDYEVLVNRLKNLLARVRRKAPELIQFDGQCYRLSPLALSGPLFLREPAL